MLLSTGDLTGLLKMSCPWASHPPGLGCWKGPWRSSLLPQTLPPNPYLASGLCLESVSEWWPVWGPFLSPSTSLENSFRPAISFYSNYEILAESVCFCPGNSWHGKIGCPVSPRWGQTGRIGTPHLLGRFTFSYGTCFLPTPSLSLFLCSLPLYHPPSFRSHPLPYFLLFFESRFYCVVELASNKLQPNCPSLSNPGIIGMLITLSSAGSLYF